MIHGLTGHGRRWRTLATRHLNDLGVLAPDLIGHGHSTFAAPWTIDANVAALASLPEAQRAVVVCRLVLDMSNDETAAALKIKPGTVKSRLSRAIDHLRNELSPDDRNNEATK